MTKSLVGDNYHTIALISHASKVMLKILQARLQQYVNHEIPCVQAGFRKGRGTRELCFDQAFSSFFPIMMNKQNTPPIWKYKLYVWTDI